MIIVMTDNDDKGDVITVMTKIMTRLKCTASVLDLYWRTAEEVAQVSQTQFSSGLHQSCHNS